MAHLASQLSELEHTDVGQQFGRRNCLDQARLDGIASYDHPRLIGVSQHRYCSSNFGDAIALLRERHRNEQIFRPCGRDLLHQGINPDIIIYDPNLCVTAFDPEPKNAYREADRSISLSAKISVGVRSHRAHSPCVMLKSS
jgi:hypothetical protein